METKYAHQLIVAVSSKGSSDEIMQAAREAGAQGGTILRGKGLDSSEAEKFLSITIGAEKEIVLILVPSEQKAAVMQSISAKGFADPEHHLLFSIPVEQVCGI